MKINFLGLPNCVRLKNETVELVAATDIGPRVLRFGFVGKGNVLGEYPNDEVKTPLGPWKPWGGHRLWTAPEAMPRSYAPDNEPVELELSGDSIRLKRLDAPTAIEKEIFIALEPQGALLRHRVVNRGKRTMELAAWALTIMAPGGTVLIPQEPIKTWEEDFSAARSMTLWHYTDLTDPRWAIGRRFVALRSDPARSAPQKFGALDRQGWAAYVRGKTVFIKRFGCEEGAVYPDFGSNVEAYTAGGFMELETLGPLRRLEPGQALEHSERWRLFDEIELGEDEESWALALEPLAEKTPLVAAGPVGAAG